MDKQILIQELEQKIKKTKDKDLKKKLKIKLKALKNNEIVTKC